MNIEEIALRLLESNCSVEIYFNVLDKLEKHTTRIQELEKEKAHIEIAYEEDYKEQTEEIKRLNNIIKEVRKYIKENTKEGPIKDKRYFYSPEQANELLEILNKGE